MATPKRVHGPALVTNAAVTKYTVPAAMRFLLRHVHVQNPSAAAVDLTLSIGADAAAVRLFDGYPIPADTALDFWFYVPVEAAEIIQALASVTNILTLVIAGDLEAI